MRIRFGCGLDPRIYGISFYIKKKGYSFYFEMTRGRCIVKCKWILQSINTTFYTGSKKATCFDWKLLGTMRPNNKNTKGVYFTNVFQGFCSRGYLPNVVCLSRISKTGEWGGLDPLMSSHESKILSGLVPQPSQAKIVRWRYTVQTVSVFYNVSVF